MTNKIIIASIIAIAFLSGTIASGTLVFAQERNDDPINLLERIGLIIQGLQADVEDLKIQVEYLISKNNESNAVFTFVAGLGTASTGPTYAGVGGGSNSPDTNPYIMPDDGELHNLVVHIPEALGEGKTATWTIMKNGEETELSCSISDEETACKNFDDSVTVNAQDRVVGKLVANEPTESVNLRPSSSVVFTIMQ